jgi:hypothetical protein
MPMGRIGAGALLSTRKNMMPDVIAAPVETNTSTSVKFFSLEDMREREKSKLPTPAPRESEPAKSTRKSLVRNDRLATVDGIAGRTFLATIREDRTMKGSCDEGEGLVEERKESEKGKPGRRRRIS